MARRLTTTIALVLALAASGCGKDDTSDTTANDAAKATQVSDAATGGTSTGGSRKSSGSKTTAGSKKTSSESKTTSAGSKKTTSGSKKTSSGSKKTSASKTSSGSKKSGSTSSSGSKTSATAGGGAPSSGTAGDADPRLAVVATVRRYQKDFVDGDSNDACLLLTAAGRKQMIAGGRGQTCAESVKRILDQARDSDIELIKETRAGIHVSDVKIRGDDATVSIGKGQRLRMLRQGGRWLVDDPSP